MFVVLSDLHDPDALGALKRLSQQHDCVALQLEDPAERAAAGPGFFRASEAETGREFVTHGRKRWIDPSAPRRGAEARGVDHLRIRIGEPFAHSLRQIFRAAAGWARGNDDPGAVVLLLVELRCALGGALRARRCVGPGGTVRGAPSSRSPEMESFGRHARRAPGTGALRHRARSALQGPQACAAGAAHRRACGRTASDFRYDLEYWGLEPGEHDLRTLLARKDGSSTSGIAAAARQDRLAIVLSRACASRRARELAAAGSAATARRLVAAACCGSSGSSGSCSPGASGARRPRRSRAPAHAGRTPAAAGRARDARRALARGTLGSSSCRWSPTGGAARSSRKAPGALLGQAAHARRGRAAAVAARGLAAPARSAAEQTTFRAARALPLPPMRRVDALDARTVD
jgi:hypothetical protein